MTRDLAQEPVFDIEDIQGDILVGLIKKTEHLIFFEIADAALFRRFLATLPITSMAECLDQKALIGERKAAGLDGLVPTPGLNIAFTFDGLVKLGLPSLNAAPLDPAFKAGMPASQAALADPAATGWKILKPGTPVHGVFLVTASTAAELADTYSRRLAPAAANGWTSLHHESGVVRPSPVEGHEHFGFADGVSQPGVRGQITPGVPLTPGMSPDENQGMPGQDLLWPGEFVFGLAGQTAAPGKTLADEGPVIEPPLPAMANGAYMVFRRLAQKVPEFHQAVKAAAATTLGSANELSADLLGAQMVGRWRSGAPIIIADTEDNPTFADGMPLTNDFEYGDDREGLVCPWAAHIRKAYPRNDVLGNTNPDPDTVDDAEAFTQTHRMLRRGIAFGPELTEPEAFAAKSDPAHARGLLFLCYVTSVVDQFEFVQKSWANNAGFSQPGAGIDPIIGQSTTPPKPFLGAAPFSKTAADKPSFTFADFVEMQGGGYFFAPSISAIRSF